MKYYLKDICWLIDKDLGYVPFIFNYNKYDRKIRFVLTGDTVSVSEATTKEELMNKISNETIYRCADIILCAEMQPKFNVPTGWVQDSKAFKLYYQYLESLHPVLKAMGKYEVGSPSDEVEKFAKSVASEEFFDRFTSYLNKERKQEASKRNKEIQKQQKKWYKKSKLFVEDYDQRDF